MDANKPATDCDLVLGNSNRRFSGVTSTMLQNLRFQQHLMDVRVLGAYHLSNPELAIGFWEAVRLLRRPKADGKWRIFHARRNDEMIQALVLKKFFGAKIKIVFTSTAQRSHSWLTRWLMLRMDAILSTCQAAARYLATPPAQIIHHGIQQDIFFPLDARQTLLRELNIHGDRAVGIFGRVREQKGVHLFVRACIAVLPQFPDVSAVIGGAITPQNRSFVAELEREIAQAKLSDRIRFIGEQPFENLPKLFRAMSVVMALSNNEGFGLTVLEAMSSGAAVIATDAGAWREVIREGVDGFVVPVDDLKAITDRLFELLENPDKTRNMGDNGRASILENFTVEREAKALCDFFKTLQ